MKRFLTLTLAIYGLAGNAKANDDVVTEMFQVMDIEAQLNGGFEAMLPMIDQMAVRFNLDQKSKAELLTIYRTWFDEDIDRAKMLNEIKVLYGRTFTQNEIKQVTEFYRTPVGQKFLKKSPELMKLGAQIGMLEAQAKQALLQARLMPFFEKHGIGK